MVRQTAATKRSRNPHEPHPVARTPKRLDGPVRA
jgi:hypothetical protein